MKVPPLNLSSEMNRVGMPLPMSAELFWRSYQSMPFTQSITGAPPSPLTDVKSQLDMKTLPANLAGMDPRTWTRDDVITFLRWVEREYDLPSIDATKFCMNGKALMMLNKGDLTERAPDAGDILHNTLQQMTGASAHVPPSPITPHHPILSPSPLTSASANPSQPWGLQTLQAADLQTLSHLIQQNSSVTLSPAHSEQSGGSPRHPDNVSTTSNGSAPGYSQSGNHSDSEDSTRDSTSPQRSPIPVQLTANPNLSVQTLATLTQYRAAAAAAAAQHKHQGDYKQTLQHALQMQQQCQSNQQLHHQVPNSASHLGHQQTRSSPPLPAAGLPTTSQASTTTTEEPVETGTNGRLLWDFLQQLLNDREQRYNRYIAWRNAETGVFKIVDPPGLARLWGIQKNHLSMNYDKMSRALRYYYRVNILKKVQGERHCYQFLRNPSELRNIKNISSLKSIPASRAPQIQPQPQQQPQFPVQPSQVQQQQQQHHLQQQLHFQQQLQQQNTKVEDEGPTDLSMATLHNSSSQDHRSSSPQEMTIDEHYIKMEEDDTINVGYDQ